MTPNWRVTWQATSTTKILSHARRHGSVVAARGARAAAINSRFRLHEGIELVSPTKNIVFSRAGKTHQCESRSRDCVQIERAIGPERYRQASHAPVDTRI